MSSEGFLRLTVEEDLAAYQTENAVFVAEKLVAAFPSPESKHLLARAYLQANDAQRAFASLVKFAGTCGCRLYCCRWWSHH